MITEKWNRGVRSRALMRKGEILHPVVRGNSNNWLHQLFFLMPHRWLEVNLAQDFSLYTWQRLHHSSPHAHWLEDIDEAFKEVASVIFAGDDIEVIAGGGVGKGLATVCDGLRVGDDRTVGFLSISWSGCWFNLLQLWRCRAQVDLHWKLW